MLLDALRRRNPACPLYACRDPRFEAYGRRLDGFDAQECLAAAARLPQPEDGAAYRPAVPELETPGMQRLAGSVFGGLPAQTGYCWGRSQKLNALEWHKTAEINVAVTPLVLLLGLYRDLRGDRYDTAAIEGFLLEPGEAVELYPMTLHYTPCETSEAGFGCLVLLPQGTNLPLEEAADDPRLFRKNKWLLAHEENRTLIERGVRAGLYGINHAIKGVEP